MQLTRTTLHLAAFEGDKCLLHDLTCQTRHQLAQGSIKTFPDFEDGFWPGG